MDIKKQITSFFKGEILNDTSTLETYSRDASLFAIKPKLVVFPKDAEDIQQLVSFASEQQEISLTVRSGGTDMTGGPLNESIIVDVSRHLNQIRRVSDNSAVTEPGILYRDFENETLKYNLLLPPYPASREICTVGGMVANNAGGEKTLAYGKTEDYVQQLKVVLRDGNEYTFAPVSQQQLEKKMKLGSLEGEIYRAVFELVDKNYELLQQAKPKVSKNSAGYYLWNVWDKKIFDLTQLFTGSQGTLGIITEINFRLVTPNPHSQMLVIFLKNISNLAEIIKRVLTYHPESFESYDDHTLKVAVRYFPQLLRQMKTKNILSLIWQLKPELKMILTGGVPKLILLAEFTGHDKDEVHKRAEAAQASLRQFSAKTRLPKSDVETGKYWTIRRESFNLLRHHIKHKRTAPFIDDFIVLPEQLPQFLPQLEDIMSQYDITYTIAGHVGDAHFHVIPLMDLSKPQSRRIIRELEEKVYNLVLKFGGSISGEHNDGLIRSHYLEKMYGKEVYELFKQIKTVFDPNNIFNPGKKVGASQEYAMKHLVKD